MCAILQKEWVRETFVQKCVCVCIQCVHVYFGVILCSCMCMHFFLHMYIHIYLCFRWVCVHVSACLGIQYVNMSVCTHAAMDRLAADSGLTSATSFAFCIAVFWLAASSCSSSSYWRRRESSLDPGLNSNALAHKIINILKITKTATKNKSQVTSSLFCGF